MISGVLELAQMCIRLKNKSVVLRPALIECRAPINDSYVNDTKHKRVYVDADLCNTTRPMENKTTTNNKHRKNQNANASKRQRPPKNMKATSLKNSARFFERRAPTEKSGTLERPTTTPAALTHPTDPTSRFWCSVVGSFPQ